MTLANPAAFFNSARRGPMGPDLSQSEVDGAKFILEAAAHQPLAFVAYMLATAWHECWHSLTPIREKGGHDYFMRMYDVSGARPKLARDNGNTVVGDGAKYFGRGFVQLTWKPNYAKAGRILGADLVNNPDLALVPRNAGLILVRGMTEGWFTGKKLSDYLPRGGKAGVGQFVQCRRIINGLDQANTIAGYALHFQDDLAIGGWA